MGDTLGGIGVSPGGGMKMPWKERSLVLLREEFVKLAGEPGANISALSREFGISRKSAYKWLARFRACGPDGLADRSRRPHASPHRSPAAVESLVEALRDKHPAWGGRKLRAALAQRGYPSPPSASTVTEILRRRERLDAEECRKHQPHCRFERAHPNELWQMDFKGHFLGGDARIYPLDLLDDHSRYCVCLRASADQRTATVREALEGAFRENGLPWSILCDNGGPWGDDRQSPHTKLGVWLMRLGIQVLHGRPYHPETQGKLERFHRTLAREAILGYCLEGPAWQGHFDQFRQMYNSERPHEALGNHPPCTRYRRSERVFPEALPPVVYEAGDIVRQVNARGHFCWRGLEWHLCKAFAGQPVALRPGAADGCYDVIYSAFKVARLDLRTPGSTVTHVSVRV